MQDQLACNSFALYDSEPRIAIGVSVHESLDSSPIGPRIAILYISEDGNEWKIDVAGRYSRGSADPMCHLTVRGKRHLDSFLESRLFYAESMVLGTRNMEPALRTLTADDVPKAPTARFFNRLNRLLEQHGFDAFAQDLCQPFYAQRLGRPSLPPGVYFRMLLLGLDSERRIALPAANSLGMRAFLGYGLHQSTPDHSTLSRMRRLLSMEVHEQVFGWCLDLLLQWGLASDTQVAVDATTLQANAS